MSFPPRHPMAVPGMPHMPPGMIPPGYGFPQMTPIMPMGMMAGHILPPGLPFPPMPDTRPLNRGPPPIRKPMVMHKRTSDDRKHIGHQGPTITVFVGNITERAADALVKQLLQKCGSVISWKRVQGASGKLQAFGFCEYGDPESALRAMRILHEWEIADKKLVVKVDAKTKAQLDEYKANKRKTRQEVDNAGGKTPTESERDDYEEIDEETKKEDSIIRTGIQVLLKEHEYELTRPVVQSETRKRSAKSDKGDEDGKESKDNLDEMDLEEDKKNLIHREIDKFRDTMKKLEEEKEKERERREKEKERRDRDRDRDRRDRESTGMLGGMNNRLHSRTPDRLKDPTRDRSRERSYDRSRSRSHERDRSRERERSRDREIALQERIREKDYDRDKREKDKEREREEEEEAYERRKLERKLREKEAAYQERLRNWETRERKRARENEKYKEKEEEKRTEEIKEAKRLKEFLEDYDDERDDPKYYKGSALARRIKDREKEIELDNRDRQREKEELEELRLKLMEEGHPDPLAELERIKKENEEKFKPVVKVLEQTRDKPEPVKPKLLGIGLAPTIISVEDDDVKMPLRKLVDDDTTQNSLSGLSDVTTPKEDMKRRVMGFSSLKPVSEPSTGPSENAAPVKEEGKGVFMGFSGLKIGASPTQQGTSSTAASSTSHIVSIGGKKKRLTVGEVFNTDEDESSDGQPRKRKLVPLDYSEDEKKAVSQSGGSTSNNSTQEEKRKHIKNLIDKIPTEKDKLFAYGVDWSIVDNVLMERRIRPWINKKIVEYIGEEEATLVDFICSKLMAGSAPQSILDDVQMVLDDEAEVFVVKMWRLLIYEIEAKKLGLVK